MARDPDGYVTKAEFFAGDQKIGEVVMEFIQPPPPNQEQTFDWTWKNVAAGEYRVWAKVTDDRGATKRSDDRPILVRQPDPSFVKLVAAGSVWKYHYAASGPGEGWTAAAFDDSQWASGNAQLGYGDGDEATKLPTPTPRPVTAYFRHAFSVADTQAYSRLVVRLLRDDGAAVYLNGRELLRSNLPDGPLTHNTLAREAVGGADESTFKIFEIDRTLLTNGQNLLAVEVHQVNVSSSDISFDLELLGRRADVPEPPPVVSIVASTPQTSEPSPLALIAPGKFVVSRTGSKDKALTVHLKYEGTATPELDYEPLPRELTIAAGATSAELMVLAKHDTLPEETETVVAVLVPAPSDDATLPPSYVVAPDRGSARVFIRDDDHEKPVVTIVAERAETSEPGPNAGVEPGKLVVRRSGSTQQTLGVWLKISGTAESGSDYAPMNSPVIFESGVSARELRIAPHDDALVEGDETVVVEIIPLPPNVDPVHPADYIIDPEQKVARVIIHDNDAPVGHSTLEITSPSEGMQFVAPAVVRIAVTAIDPLGDIRLVSFFANGQLIGKSEHLTRDAVIPGKPRFHVFEWTNVGEGAYELIAKATDTAGMAVSSKPVHIKVLGTPDVPVVSIFATVPETLEPSPNTRVMPGQFTIKRHGSGDGPLPVFLQISGTARNGVDYTEIARWVIVPADAGEAKIAVAAIDDDLTEGDETVELKLTTEAPDDFPLSIPFREFRIDPEHAAARVVIHDNDTVAGPTLKITAPADGERFVAPAAIKIQATAIDPQGYIPRVEFYAGHTRIGVSELAFLVAPEPGTPLEHAFEWRNPPAGEHVLTARAVTANGIAVTSEPVRIVVAPILEGTVVRLTAIDPEATELPPQVDAIDFARFSIKRDGDLTQELLVFVSVHGTAQSEKDFQPVKTPILLAAGEASATIDIVPVSDETAESMETVGLRLELSPLLAGGPIGNHYRIDPDFAEAAAVIYDRSPPADGAVELAIPSQGAQYGAGEPVRLLAAGFHPSVDLLVVDFYAGDQKIGSSHVLFNQAGSGGLLFHEFVWANAPAGEHVITAQAAFSNGAVLKSTPVAIRIEGLGFPAVGIRAIPRPSLEPVPDADYAPKLFEIFRTGSTAEPLSVYFEIGGTATPGTDYAELPRHVLIPAGRSETHLFVEAKDDTLPEGEETVRVEIKPPPPIVDPPVFGMYRIDPEHASATVIILDNDGPVSGASIEITAPKQGENFVDPAVVVLAATAVDPKSYIPRVEFFIGHERVGVSEVHFIRPPDPGTPVFHTFEWKQPPAGLFTLTARGVDSNGVRIESKPVTFSVIRERERVVVTVHASDAKASESISADGSVDTATFTFVRAAGPRDIEVTVSFSIHGTAQNGVDYKEIPGSVKIAAGAEAARVVILPIPDKALEGEETIAVKILEPVCPEIFPPPAWCYVIGQPSEARAVIVDGTSIDNHPPRVTVVRPHQGAVFLTTDVVEIRAEASDSDGQIAKLELFAGDRLLETTAESSLTVRWSNPTAGTHVITARAVDDKGAESSSAPVRILVRPAEELAFAKRDLPSAYAPGNKFVVNLRVDPPHAGHAYAVEEAPPRDWSVGAVSHEGVYDAATGKVKFGPYTDQQSRLLTYELTPPAGATGRHEFSGVASVDGKEFPITGDRVIDPVGDKHPADNEPGDNRLTVHEVSAYAGAWKAGAPWPTGPTPIPISYVTRAGILWKGGETYTLDPSAGSDPLWWVNVPPPPRVISLAGGAQEHGASRESPALCQPGQPATIRIAVQPRAGVSAYAVEETVPPGWTVGEISHEGHFNSATRTIRWGLFLDDTARVLTFVASPPADKTATAAFEGWASFDGHDVALSGAKEVAFGDASTAIRFTGISRSPEGKVRVRVNGRPNQLFTIEVSNDMVTWQELSPRVLIENELEVEDETAATDGFRFYRAKPLGP
ncbi:MAG: Ig-like domain-containing protein [Verrucomicrobiota bacterium]